MFLLGLLIGITGSMLFFTFMPDMADTLRRIASKWFNF